MEDAMTADKDRDPSVSCECSGSGTDRIAPAHRRHPGGQRDAVRDLAPCPKAGFLFDSPHQRTRDTGASTYEDSCCMAAGTTTISCWGRSSSRRTLADADAY